MRQNQSESAGDTFDECIIEVVPAIIVVGRIVCHAHQIPQIAHRNLPVAVQCVPETRQSVLSVTPTLEIQILQTSAYRRRVRAIVLAALIIAIVAIALPTVVSVVIVRAAAAAVFTPA